MRKAGFEQKEHLWLNTGEILLFSFLLHLSRHTAPKHFKEEWEGKKRGYGECNVARKQHQRGTVTAKTVLNYKDRKVLTYWRGMANSDKQAAPKLLHLQPHSSKHLAEHNLSSFAWHSSFTLIPFKLSSCPSPARDKYHFAKLVVPFKIWSNCTSLPFQLFQSALYRLRHRTIFFKVNCSVRWWRLSKRNSTRPTF